MKKYTFKDGFKCFASTVKEAIKKHKVFSAYGEKEYRITWRSEIFIKAKSEEEAEEKFEKLRLFSADALKLNADWVETNSIEEKG